MTSPNQQQLFLIISRHNLNPNIIPPFKIILPTLQLLSPLKLFTSMKTQIIIPPSSKQNNTIINTLYQALLYHLQNQSGQVNLNQTMNMIYNFKSYQQSNTINKKQSNIKISPWKFRICILGQQIISWDIVMKFKLKNIVIDTIGQNKRLQQISFATGGINKSPILYPNITKLFMTIYSLSTQSRKKFNFLYLSKDQYNSTQSIQFTVDCVCCPQKSQQLSNQCYVCSSCLAIHCSKLPESCFQCGVVFQNMTLQQKPC